MGVPAFYKWLSERYPKTIVYAKEDNEENLRDLTLPNPNAYEFDNFYIDMNCLIHPCTHPEEGVQPLSEEEMFVAIFKYVDRLFSIIRPRKVLYLAIDGVAPRAKMNQQRSRRFRASQEADEAKKEALKVSKENGLEIQATSQWDSNVITPGTAFMHKLSKRLRDYIFCRQHFSSGWRNISVIFSDSQSPGEGEHKLMNFIRSQRSQEGYDPNTTHCLYGLDADLIMLGLATHEVNFNILREEVLFGREKKNQSFVVDSVLYNKSGNENENVVALNQYELLKSKKKPFQILRIWVLREYLSHEFAVSQFRSSFNFFKYDFERCIDDFIFLCFFVGNDFLPHLPTLSIREGGLELLLDLYKRFLPTLDGYLTNSGVLEFKRVEVILKALGSVEDEIFKRRRNFELGQQRRRQQMQAVEDKSGANKKPRIEEKEGEGEEGELKVVDEVRLGDTGWKKRYYESKFSDASNPSSAEHITSVAEEYVLGLCWVLMYYYKGCQSWKWFYPYHFAPFASDLTKLAHLQNRIYSAQAQLNLQKSLPFTPYEQLLGVLPSSSAHALPKPFHWYMTDPDSPIIDFYPTDFKYDSNGKTVRWLWIALLPFVDDKRISKVMTEVESKLTPKERSRNLEAPVLLFVSCDSDLGSYLKKRVGATDPTITSEASSQSSLGSKLNLKRKKIRAKKKYGICGYASLYKDSIGTGDALKFKNHFLQNVSENKTLCYVFENPKIRSKFDSGSQLLKNAIVPSCLLSEGDVQSIYSQGNRRGHSVGNIYAELNDQRRSHGPDYEQRYSERERENYPVTSLARSYNALNAFERSTGTSSWGSMEPRINQKRTQHSFSGNATYHTQYSNPDSNHDRTANSNSYHDHYRSQGETSYQNSHYSVSRQHQYQEFREPPRSKEYLDELRGQRGDRDSTVRDNHIPPKSRGNPNDVLDLIESRLKRKRN